MVSVLRTSSSVFLPFWSRMRMPLDLPMVSANAWGETLRLASPLVCLRWSLLTIRPGPNLATCGMGAAAKKGDATKLLGETKPRYWAKVSDVDQQAVSSIRDAYVTWEARYSNDDKRDVNHPKGNHTQNKQIKEE